MMATATVLSRRAPVWPSERADDAVAQPRAFVGAPSLSCVGPCYNEAQSLRLLLPALEKMLLKSDLRWEVIVVDDGSDDDTSQVVRAWCQLEGFRCIRLSRNFGKEAAMSAGLSAARGDAVVLLDGDMQHPPELVLDMIRQWRAGADVVYAVRKDRAEEAAYKRWGSRLFYRLLNAGGRMAFPKDAGDFRLMDRKVVRALLALPERTRFMKGLYAWVGFDAQEIPYEPAQRAKGKSHYGVLRLLSLAVDGLTSFTTWPLRMISVAGVLLAVPALGYGVFLVLDHLLGGATVPGWTTIAVGLMFLIGMQMISVGILGEYIARIFDEVKARPLYVVQDEWGTGIRGDAQ